MIALVKNHRYVLSPPTVAPVNEMDMVLLPQGLKALKHVTREAGLGRLTRLRPPHQKR